MICYSGGEGEIRTHGTRKGSTVFETARFNHSRTSPGLSTTFTIPIFFRFLTGPRATQSRTVRACRPANRGPLHRTRLFETPPNAAGRSAPYGTRLPAPARE